MGAATQARMSGTSGVNLGHCLSSPCDVVDLEGCNNAHLLFRCIRARDASRLAASPILRAVHTLAEKFLDLYDQLGAYRTYPALIKHLRRMNAPSVQVHRPHHNSGRTQGSHISRTAVQQMPRLHAPQCPHAARQQCSSNIRRVLAVRMFPRDAEFATQQLQGILAELQADPALSPLLDDKKLAAAIKEVAANPAALQKHANNPKVMKVLQRLLGQDLAAREAAAFAEAGTTPADMFTAMSADAELSSLLNNPTVRTAIAQIRANPRAGIAKWGSDPMVARALDLLEAALGSAQGKAGGVGTVIDVVAEEVRMKQQQQQQQQALLQQQVRQGSTGSPGRLRRRGPIFR